MARLKGTIIWDELMEVDDSEVDKLQIVWDGLTKMSGTSYASHPNFNAFVGERGLTDLAQIEVCLAKLEELGFVRGGRNSANIIVYSQLDVEHGQRSLRWLRNRARTTHAQESKLATRQVVNDILNRVGTIASLLLGGAALAYSIYQGEESKKDKSSVQQLEERLLQGEQRLLLLESQVAYLLLDSSLSTTMPSILPEDSSQQNITGGDSGMLRDIGKIAPEQR